jgi:spore germination cell wall hydrolase CwlJ-like protein
MAMAIYHESRGEPIIGQAGIGYVIMNRVRDKDFPNSVCKVINQPHQFGFITRKLEVRDPKEFENSKDIARKILNKRIPNPVGTRLYFNTYQMFRTKQKPLWINKHVFF